ncbi:hypothetical protein YPPY66_1741, partial [Yersinia pestis PY-66]|jgi:hypothetical protein
MAT